jgi:HD superfamily phosphodiesterase
MMENLAKQTVDFKSIYNTVITLLENHLPAYITYHNAAHTKGVVETTEKLADAEEVDEEEKLLLLTAALYHDTGFLRTYKNHEEASCTIARESLPKYGYTASQIEAICRIIMATKLPYHPTDKLQQIICDADLHYLGTDQYFSTAEKLIAEFKKE